MDPDPSASTDEEQVTSSINIAAKYVKGSSTSNQQYPDETSATEYAGDTEMLPSDTPEAEAEAHVEHELWSSQNDEEIDRELNPREADIRQFIRDFKDFHTLMIQLNEPQYFGRRMDLIHSSIETDLLDLLGELAYRRGEEAEELRQKAELEELLKSIKDDEDDQLETEGENEFDVDESRRAAMAVLDDLINKVTESSNNDGNID